SIDITASKLTNPPVHNPTAPAAKANGILRMNHAKPGVGMNTGRWMAGEIDGNALAWDDEAAARRAVATRDKVGRAQPTPVAARPSQAAHTNGPVHAGALPDARAPRPGFWERNGMLVGTMLVALGLLAGLVYAILFTQVFWPRLKLSSEPAGAAVLVDGVPAPGRTPLVVQVEPERRHRIEFRLDGYQRTLREITEGIGRAKTYTLTVKMARKPPTVFLPVSGRVLLNGQLVGKGREVQLNNVDRITGAVRLRVEANGHDPYEVRFNQAQEIPPTLDVPLRKRSNK
ncbi:MAG: PEGA domain-containing protein, partial [Myxococcota bacterium]